MLCPSDGQIAGMTGLLNVYNRNATRVSFHGGAPVDFPRAPLGVQDRGLEEYPSGAARMSEAKNFVFCRVPEPPEDPGLLPHEPRPGARGKSTGDPTGLSCDSILKAIRTDIFPSKQEHRPFV